MARSLIRYIVALLLVSSVSLGQQIVISRGGTRTTAANLAAVSAATDLHAGDSVLFLKGYEYKGNLTFDAHNSGVFIGAFGSGTKPVLSQRNTVPGWSTVGNWTNQTGHLWSFSIGHKARRLWNGTREFRQVYSKTASSWTGSSTIGLTADYQFWSDKSGTIWVHCSNDQPWSFYNDPIYSGPQTTSDDFGYSVFDLRDMTSVTIRGIRFEGGEFTALYLWNVDNAVIDSCDFHYVNQAFRAAYGSDSGIMTNCNFNAQDTVHHDYEAPASSADGIAYNTDLATIYKSNYWDISYCTFVGASHDAINCHGTGLAATTDCANYNKIHDCEISGGGVDYTRAYETLATSAQEGVCSYNEFYRNYVHGMTEWIQFMGDHNRIAYCVIDTVTRSWKVDNEWQSGGINMGGFEWASKNRIENNYIANCASGGIVSVYGGSGDTVYIINNAVIECGTDEGTRQGMYGASIVINSDNQRVHMRNNLCYSTLTDSPYVYRQNYYAMTPVSKLTGAQVNLADAGVDIITGNLSASPGINADYTLAEGSPAINAGYATQYAVDYFGVAVPQGSATDIGVSEYVAAPVTGKHVTPSGAGAHTGDDVANAWTMAEANASATYGDTVNIHAGFYTTQIAPVNAGTPGHPIVFKNYAADVCSVRTTNTSILITTDYVIVQGIAVQLSPAVSNQPVLISGCEHSAIINCRVYGGTTSNTTSLGNWIAFELNDVRYTRIIGNLIDRQDPATTDDDYRGDGIAIYGDNSHYNIIEGNVVRNVSHFAIAVPCYTNKAQFNIVRNNVAYNSHGLFAAGDGTKHTLFEGNRGWNPGMIDTYQSGPNMEMFADSTIVRYNMLAHDTTVTGVGTQSIVHATPPYNHYGKFVEATNELIIEGTNNPDDAEKDGRYYGNAMTAKVTFPPGYTGDQYKYSLTILDGANDGFGTAFGRNVLKNNIIAYSTGTSLIYYQNNHTNYTTISDTLDGNVLWNGTVGENILKAQTTDHSGDFTLAQAKSTFPSIRTGNLNVSPLWVDSTSDGVNRRYELSGTSPCRDAGVALTVTASSSASGQKIIQVGDASYFHYDWGNSPYDRGDSLLVGTVRVELDSIDYAANRLIVKTNLPSTISAGSSVHVLATWNTQTSTYTNRLAGSAPDIGPYEYGSSSPNPPDPPTPPGVPTNLAPAEGSTQAQPVLFRWTRVAGATTYFLTAAITDWSNGDFLSITTADSFYLFSGFPEDATIIWNVSAINSAGQSDWSPVWSFKTQADVPYPNSVVVNWDDLVEYETLTANTSISMLNVQRRDNILVVRNPSGHLVRWPAGVSWPKLSAPPQPAAGDTAVYLLVREETGVIGVDLTRLTSSGGGVTSSWVLQQLTSYLRNDEDLRLSGNQEFRKIVLRETSAPDSVIIYDDQGVLSFWDAATGWKTLAELAAGGAGGADGQDADSLQGKPLSPYRPAGKSVVTHDPDSSGYRHVPIAELGDTTGVDAGGSGEQHKLTIIDGKVQWRNDSTGVSKAYVDSLVLPVTYSPGTLSVVTGTLDSGTVASATTIDDGRSILVSEATGTPGFDIRMTFASVVEFNSVQLHARYIGNVAHTVQVQIWNPGTSGWDVLGAIASGSTVTLYTFPVTNAGVYIDGNNAVICRVYHTSAGNATHDMVIDYWVIRKVPVGGGGGVTEHGALTGLLDDDHPQYFLDADSTTLKNSILSQVLKNADSTGNMKRSDTTWVMTKAYADDYLPITGGTLTNSLAVTGSLTATTFMRATVADTIGTSGVAGNRYSWWTNTNAKLQIGVGVTGTVTMKRILYDGQSRDILSWTKAAPNPYWSGWHEFDTLRVVKYLNTYNSNIDMAQKNTSYLQTFATWNSAGTTSVFDLNYIGKFAQVTNTGTTTVDSMKVSGGLKFWVSGSSYTAERTGKVDSASIVLMMAGTSWLATTNTDSVSGPILFPKYFVVDSVMVALAGTASTDTVKVDVRYGTDYSASGTAVVTTPAQIAASGAWTKVVPNSATIPAFNSAWVKVTKKVGSSKRLTVMLKGRWQ